MLKTLLAAALLSGHAAAVPGPTRCITREEIGDLTLVSASVAVEVVRNACRTYLPETAFLATPAGADFSARLRAEGQRRLDAALAGVARLSADPNMPRAMIRPFVAGLMTEGAGADFAGFADASLCRDANEILEIASTLSPDQMARFVGAFASIADHVARTRPAGPSRIVPFHAPPQAAPRAPRPAPPETTPPTPHPAAFEAPPGSAHPPVVQVPRPPGARPATPPLQPFLCRPPE